MSGPREPDDREWLRGLYDRNRDVVFRYTVSRVGTDAAMDVVSDTFIEANRSRALFDPSRGSETSWLLGIATNLIRRWHRDEKRHETIVRSQPRLTGEEDGALASLPDRIDSERQAKEIERAIDQLPEGGVQQDAIEEWIGNDGRGFRINGHSESSSSSESSSDTAGDGIRRTLNITPFNAESSIDRRVSVAESWRSIFSLRGLESIPLDPEAALTKIRSSVDRRMGDSRQGEGPSTRVLGSDFTVLMSLSNLLMQAPLTGNQRSTLYELIATAPDWYRNDGSADVKVTNEGRAETNAGQEGILISTSMNLNEHEARIVADGERSAQFEILIDPRKGSVLETRIVLGESDSPAIWFTSDVLELRTEAAMERSGG